MRIRYFKPDDNGWKKSRKQYKDSSDKLWTVFIHEVDFIISIQSGSDELRYENKTRNLNVLKRKVREMLEKQGVEMSSEKRKGNGEKESKD